MARLDAEPLGQVTLIGRLASGRAHVRPPILPRARHGPRERLHFLLGQSTMGSRPAQVTIRTEQGNHGHRSIFPVSDHANLSGFGPGSGRYVLIRAGPARNSVRSSPGAVGAFAPGPY